MFVGLWKNKISLFLISIFTINLDIQYPGKSLPGYPVKSVSGVTLVLRFL